MPPRPFNAPRVPVSTYRLQLHSGFGFRDACAIVDYLHDLGIEHLYTSPLLMARAGSTHGYDVVDPSRHNPELGTAEQFEELQQALHRYGMGLLVDIVPNHMAADVSNPWWLDVLRHGRDSKYATYFDIDWEGGSGKLLLPVLGDEPEAVLERGELRVARDDGGFWLEYFELRLPLRGDEAELTRLLASPDSASLAAVLQEQPYRLRRWNGPQPLNYRRFFTISELAGVRVEEPQVFADSHALILRWVGEEKVTGLRIDHPDGLRDPLGYLQSLQQAVGQALNSNAERPLYVVVEKILTGGEGLREDWPVHGATGYHHLNVLGGVFVDQSGGSALRSFYERFIKRRQRFIEVVRECKRLVLDSSLRPELEGLTRRLLALAPPDEDGQPPREEIVLEALREVIACFPAYRSYVRPNDDRVGEEDRRLIETALEQASALAPELPAATWEILRGALLLEPPHFGGERLAEAREFVLRFQQLSGPGAAKGVEDTAYYRYAPLLSLNEVGGEPDEFGLTVDAFHERNASRFRRVPHALNTTSTHDTKRSMDVRCRINALSEIPDDWAAAVERWHELNREVRSAEAAIAAPSLNDEYLLYQTLLGAWPLEGWRAAAGEEFRTRIRDYMLKAIREAKWHTRWSEPNPEYERAVTDFVDALLDAGQSQEFLRTFEEFQRPISRAAMWSSLSQIVLKVTSPGVPDFYQGNELWDYSLVDPDNRRPVDYARRQHLLATLGTASDLPEWIERIEDGRLKLWVTRQCLHLRRRRSAVFAEGGYHPAVAEGERADQLIAAGRAHETGAVLAVVGRFFLRFADGAVTGSPWQATTVVVPPELHAGSYEDVLSGKIHELSPGQPKPVSELFQTLPLVLLERVE